MSDTAAQKQRPDFERLFAIASEQSGYFTAEQARSAGYDRKLLHHHTKSGRILRVGRGLHRLRDYPSSPYEHIIEAWLAMDRDRAVVSHESALELHGLSDVIPSAVHITVPRAMRSRRPREGVALHTAKYLDPSLTTTRHGICVTTPARSIADAAATGTSAEHIHAAVREALDRGLTTERRLREAAADRGPRAEQLVLESLDGRTSA